MSAAVGRIRHVGWLASDTADLEPLFLPYGRPLPYLRVSREVNGRAVPGRSLQRALIEAHTTAIARRIPVYIAPRADGFSSHLAALGNVVDRLQDRALPVPFPALSVDGEAGAWVGLFTAQQVECLAAEAGALGLAAPPPAVRVADSAVTVHRLVDPNELPGHFREGRSFRHQYRFGICHAPGRATPGGESVEALVWPNGRRTPADRGEYVACVTPELADRLGRPQFVSCRTS